MRAIEGILEYWDAPVEAGAVKVGKSRNLSRVGIWQSSSVDAMQSLNFGIGQANRRKEGHSQ